MLLLGHNNDLELYLRYLSSQPTFRKEYYLHLGKIAHALSKTSAKLADLWWKHIFYEVLMYDEKRVITFHWANLPQAYTSMFSFEDNRRIFLTWLPTRRRDEAWKWYQGLKKPLTSDNMTFLTKQADFTCKPLESFERVHEYMKDIVWNVCLK